MPDPAQIMSLEPWPHGPDLMWHIHCPTCGDSTMDRAGPSGGDHTAVTLHPDRDAYESPIETRGGYLRVELHCPAGHHHALIVANHKGSEYLALVPSEPPPDDPAA